MFYLSKKWLNDQNNWIKDCLKMIIKVLGLYPRCTLIGIMILPFITSLLNIHLHRILLDSLDTPQTIGYAVILSFILDYCSNICAGKFTWRISRIMACQLTQRMNMVKIKCGICIPGVNQTQFHDLMDEQYKLQQFLFVIPLMWSSLVTYGISIYMIEPMNDFHIRTLFTVICLNVLCLLVYMNDTSIYETPKSDGKIITHFDNAELVNMKISMGYKMDIDFELKRRAKQEDQQNFQKYIICFLNFTITLVSIVTGKVNQIHSFGNVTWMLSCLSDNIKNLQYKDYVKEFIILCETLDNYKYKYSQNVSNCQIIQQKNQKNQMNQRNHIDSVTFVNASFGYYDGDLLKNPSYTKKISDLNYQFKLGNIYYLEASNGIGKSTLIRMFKSNLYEGNVFFGSSNRKDYSYEQVAEIVFHIPQASEFTPQFSTEELMVFKGRDPWLEDQLSLEHMFGKHLRELSGGQKKRMLIYIALTSVGSQILLFDEILSELSTEETSEVKEGGGWLNRVINTLLFWKKRNKKIILLVGHGLLNIIPCHKNVIKLRMHNSHNHTKLINI